MRIILAGMKLDMTVEGTSLNYDSKVPLLNPYLGPGLRGGTKEDKIK